MLSIKDAVGHNPSVGRGWGLTYLGMIPLSTGLPLIAGSDYLGVGSEKLALSSNVNDSAEIL